MRKKRFPFQKQPRVKWWYLESSLCDNRVLCVKNAVTVTSDWGPNFQFLVGYLSNPYFLIVPKWCFIWKMNIIWDQNVWTTEFITSLDQSLELSDADKSWCITLICAKANRTQVNMALIRFGYATKKSFYKVTLKISKNSGHSLTQNG